MTLVNHELTLLRNKLVAINDALDYLVETDHGWSKEFTKLNKERKILKRSIRYLERQNKKLEKLGRRK